MTARPSQARHSVPGPKVRPRRIELDYPHDGLPRHYVNGDLVMSHVVSLLSSVFPEGEDFFVRTVRNFRDRVTDPHLRAHVAGFIGQEASHGRDHRAFNELLHELGYPTKAIDRLTGVALRFGERALPNEGPARRHRRPRPLHRHVGRRPPHRSPSACHVRRR